MSSSVIAIYNLALLRCGSTMLVSAVDEATNEARLCTTLYEQCRDFVLRDFPWRFAKRRVALVQKAGTPPSSWGYQYAKPTGCLHIRCIATPGSRTPLTEQKIPFELAADGGGEIIYTDLADAELIYTERVTDTTRFDPTFVSALAFNMAAELCIPLRGKADLAGLMRQSYSYVVSQAAAHSLGEGFEQTPDCSFLAVRNG